VSAQPGITKTVTALAFSSIFFRQGCSPQLRAAQKLRVLFSQAATGTTPQALSAMNAMIQLNVVALHHLVRGGAMVSHAPQIPTLRRSSTRAVWRVCHTQTKKKGEVFRRHTFPPFWLTNSKLTKFAAAAGSASRSVISIPRARSSFCCIRSGIPGGR
jgi:hypothetical protein